MSDVDLLLRLAAERGVTADAREQLPADLLQALTEELGELLARGQLSQLCGDEARAADDKLAQQLMRARKVSASDLQHGLARQRELMADGWYRPLSRILGVGAGTDSATRPAHGSSLTAAQLPVPPGYELAEELGAGGMGRVYRGRQLALDREVAIKFLRGHCVSEEHVSRFRREAHLLARLSHPGIVEVHEVGQIQDVDFIAMELVDGHTLDRWACAHDGRAERLALFEQIADAVAHAHGRGVIHRDLKPANVLVDGEGRPRVLDFGLGRPLDDDQELTRSDAVLGSPYYMAPEQVRGDHEQIDQATDVFALGVILYELLAGQRPFQGNSAAALYKQILDCEPPRLRRVPRDLGEIVRKAMAPEPERRYPDASALAADVARYRAGQPVQAQPPSRLYVARKWVRRHPTAAALLVTLLPALIAGGTYHYLGITRALSDLERETRKRAAAEKRLARRAIAAARARKRAERNLADAKRLGGLGRLQRLVAAERALFWTPLRPGTSGELLHPPTRGPLDEARHRIRAWIAQVGAMQDRLPEYRDASAAARKASAAASADDWLSWKAKVLADLVRGIEQLDALRTTVTERVEHYDAMASGRHAQRWASARREIAISQKYGGLTIPPQVGLVPLGADPHSGLHEFAVDGSGEIPTRAPGRALVIGDSTAIVLVLIPAGSHEIGFDRANENERPVHRARLDAFFIGKTEVTQHQWAQLTGQWPSHFVATGKNVDGFRATRRHPVEQVDWSQATTGLARLGMLLPTETQWEAAARGGRSSIWWTGNDARALQKAANVADQAIARRDQAARAEKWDDGHIIHAPVASFTGLRHPFGLFDVAGNVHEWCRDVYHSRLYRFRHDGGGRRAIPPEIAAGAMLRVYRGGGWSQVAFFARSAYRIGFSPTVRDTAVGIRASRAITK